MTATVAALRVDRRWIGAPAGTLANPTVWLIAVTYGLLAVGTAGHLVWGWPAWWTIAVNAVAIYLGFTPLHEAMHGVAHSSRRANEAIGWLGGLPLTVALPLFRGVHHEHHSHTNDALRDPDLIVAHRPRWLLPVWCAAINFSYRHAFYGRRLWRTRVQLAQAAAVDVLIPVVVIMAVVGGWLGSLFVIWLVPALLALLFLAFAFDFLPHYPYDTDARYFDTRIYPGAAWNVLLLGQNYHLIHHLWTTIPWYRYRWVFGDIAQDLADRGCRIGWRVSPLPASARCGGRSTA